MIRYFFVLNVFYCLWDIDDKELSIEGKFIFVLVYEVMV